MVSSNRRLRLAAEVRPIESTLGQTEYKDSELVYQWELFVVAGASSSHAAARCMLTMFYDS